LDNLATWPGAAAQQRSADGSLVSAILGHSNVKVTQEAYAELLTPTIEAAFMRVMGAGSALPGRLR
jgi:integrase